jgi:hypothetical protein
MTGVRDPAFFCRQEKPPGKRRMFTLGVILRTATYLPQPLLSLDSRLRDNHIKGPVVNTSQKEYNDYKPKNNNH